MAQFDSKPQVGVTKKLEASTLSLFFGKLFAICPSAQSRFREGRVVPFKITDTEKISLHSRCGAIVALFALLRSHLNIFMVDLVQLWPYFLFVAVLLLHCISDFDTLTV